jgi:GDP-4-dehydro-6-deoxy-D-mannose reductase
VRTLVTGGAGFAGSHLVEHLLERSQEVTVLAAEGEGLANLASILSRVRVVHGDLRDPDRLFEVLGDVRPQRIYHLAALSNPTESLSNPGLTYEVNFGGTLNLLLAWRRLELDCRFLSVSSSEVYGPVRPEDLPLREDFPLRPASPYAGSKAAGELLAIQFFESYKLPIVRVRPFNHTGPRQLPTSVCSDFARQIAEINLGMRPSKVTVGNLQISRDFSDVRDIVRGYDAILEKGISGEVYQLGAGRPVVLEEVLQTLLKVCLKRVEVAVEPSRFRPAEAPVVWGDTSKAENVAGWTRRWGLEQTLRDLELYWEETLRS